LRPNLPSTGEEGLGAGLAQAAAGADGAHGQKRAADDSNVPQHPNRKPKPSNDKPKRPLTPLPRLTFATAFGRLRNFADGYMLRYSSSRSDFLTGTQELDPDDANVNVHLAMGAARALLRNESEGGFVSLQSLLLKLRIALVYKDKYIDGQPLTRYPHKQRSRAPRGRCREFATEVLGLPDDDKHKQMFARNWLVPGNKCVALAGSAWNGRWVLALMDTAVVEKWKPETGFDLEVWMEGWDMTPEERARLQDLAREFVDAVAEGKVFATESFPPL